MSADAIASAGIPLDGAPDTASGRRHHLACLLLGELTSAPVYAARVAGTAVVAWGVRAGYGGALEARARDALAGP